VCVQQIAYLEILSIFYLNTLKGAIGKIFNFFDLIVDFNVAIEVKFKSIFMQFVMQSL
jgi:hypothetical protein